MAYRVSWSSRAIKDVEAIAAYIAVDSPRYAAAVVRKIITLTRTLNRFPESGRMVPEFQDSNIREMLAYSYRIIRRERANYVSDPRQTKSNRSFR